jgi:hypothetical protein
MRKKELAYSKSWGSILKVASLVFLGMLLGSIFVYATDGERTFTFSLGEPETVEERLELQNEAINIALSDSRVLPLTLEKEYRLLSILYNKYTVKELTKEQLGLNSWRSEVQLLWDGKHRALVTILYNDGSGYHVDVNITDGLVGGLGYFEKVIQHES